MLYLVIALIALGVIAAILGLLSHNKDGSSDVISNSTATCATCNGNDPRCEQECMMEAATKPIEYFDDEAEMFREVLYTMKTEEVKDWCRSLTLRRVNLPDQVKDEVLLIIAN